MNTIRPILLALTAVTALSVAYPAKADAITTFNVSGTCTPFAPFTGTTFSGTITIDVTAGTATGIGITFQGLTLFNMITNSAPFGGSGLWQVIASDSAGYSMDLEFLTGHTPGSLVGFTGGPIESGAVVQIATNNPAYSVNGGSITAPAGVPDAGSTLPLLGFASLGLVALRRKLSC